MDARIRDLIDGRPQGKVPDLAAIEKWLGAPLALEKDTGAWRFYGAPIARSPFAKADVRLARDGSAAFVVLDADPKATVHEKDLDLKSLGLPANVDINPRVPPEGTIAYLYHLDGERVWFSFTHGARRLRSVSIRWGK